MKTLKSSILVILYANGAKIHLEDAKYKHRNFRLAKGSTSGRGVVVRAVHKAKSSNLC